MENSDVYIYLMFTFFSGVYEMSISFSMFVSGIALLVEICLIKCCIFFFFQDYLQRCNGKDVGKFRYPGGMDKTHRRKIIGFLQDNLWIGAS